MGLGKFVVVFFLAICSTKALPVHDNASEQNSSKTEDINYRLPNDTAPLNYDIKFIPYISEDNFTFDGEATIEFKVVTTTSDVSLHSWNLTYDESAAKLISETGDILAPESCNYDDLTEILRLHFKRNLERGKYTLKLKYRGILSDDLYGFYRTHYTTQQGDLVWMATTQFEPVAARRAFPCWDEPALKATFDISIKHYPNYTALSNMPAKGKPLMDENDGKVWTHFERTPVMSTYLVAFVVADYENVTNADGTVNVWGRPEILSNARLIHEVAEKASAELESYTNSTVRVPKMDHVAVPEHGAGAMENWGLITYPEYAFSYNDDEDTVNTKIRVITTAVHEVTHQWFGNVVSPTWWSHLWLNEGFATYFQYYIIDKIFNNTRAMDAFMVNSVQMSLSHDSASRLRPIDASAETPDEIDSAFSMSTYTKAAGILRMLSHVLTEDVFRTGVLKYLKAHEYDSASPDCLWTAMQSALDESDFASADFSVKEVMDTWIMQRSHPLVTVERDYVTGDVKIMQQDYANLTSPLMKKRSKFGERIKDEQDTGNGVWWIPINYVTETNPDFSDTRAARWLAPDRNLTVSGISPEDWMIVNKQEMGYYRVNYDLKNWEKIATYLNVDDFTKIHVLNRAQIIDDVIHLTLSGQTSPRTLFQIANYLSRESDYLPWFPLFNFISEIESLLMFPEAQAVLKPWLLNLMEHIMEDVGFVGRPDDDIVTRLKRRTVLHWACKLGQPKCQRAAATALLQYLQDPKTQKIQPDLDRWTFCMGINGGNETVWNEIVELYMEDQMTIMGYLDCVANPAIIQKYLNMSLSEDPANATYDTVAVVFQALGNPINLDTVLDFLLRNWEQVSLSPDQAERLIRFVSYHIVTEEQSGKLKELMKVRNLDSAESTQIWQRHQSRFQEASTIIRKWIHALD